MSLGFGDEEADLVLRQMASHNHPDQDLQKADSGLYSVILLMFAALH
jgi:hypothetical protein